MASDPMRWHPETKTDQRLLYEARRGCAESFELVYRRHHAVVLAFLARRPQQPELAADLMAETFAALLVLVRDPDGVLPPIPVAWLLLTARNLLIDSHRRGRVDDAARRRLGMRPLALDDRDLERVEEISAEVDLLEQLASQLEPAQLAAFRDDRRFHPFPENYPDESNCAAVDARGHGFASFSFTGLPASALGLTDRGPAVSGCLSLLPPKCPAGDARDMYFGLLGPDDAVNITYASSNGRIVTVPATGADGAYLIVTPSEGSSHEPSGSSFTNGLLLSGPDPIRAVTYRDGHTCRASDVYPCPPIGFAPIAGPHLKPADLASPISTREVAARSYCEQARGPTIRPCGAAVPSGFTRVPSSPQSLLFELTFTARVASTTDDSFYYSALFFPNRPTCHEIATGSATSTNIRPGQRLTFDELVLAGCHGIVRGVIRYHPHGAGGSAPEPDPTDPNSIRVGRVSIRIP